MNSRENKKSFIILLGFTLQWFIALVALAFIGTIIGDAMGAGEQNIFAWIFGVIFYNPSILIACVVSIYIIIYLYFAITE